MNQIASSVAARLYADAQPATRPAEPESQQAVGGPSLTDMADDFVRAMGRAEETVAAGLTGKADPQAVVEALAATELAVQTAVTVRDRVVEAYQEILRMPV